MKKYPFKTSLCPRSLALAACLLAAHTASGQIYVGGSVDLSALSGGSDSGYIVNEISPGGKKTVFGVHQANLFAVAELGRGFSVRSRIQSDSFGGGALHEPRISLAAVDWLAHGGAVNASIGRFVSPFGLYPQRQLAFDNAFTSAPMLYGYFINISSSRGFWHYAGDGGSYEDSDVGLNTHYYGGYATGMRVAWVVSDGRVALETAFVNGAPASDNLSPDFQTAAVIARADFKPALWWRQGFSFAHGSFMRPDALNNELKDLGRFRQTVVGADFTMGYGYFELSGELAFSSIRAPEHSYGKFVRDDAGRLVVRTYEHVGAYTDLVYEPPFLTGWKIALRLEGLFFGGIAGTGSASGPYADSYDTEPWDDDVTGVALAVNYRMTESAQLKFSFGDQFFDAGEPRDTHAFRAMLNVLF